MLESEFTKNISSCSATLCDISFVELSYFLQKNFEMNATASEVIAIRLHETFKIILLIRSSVVFCWDTQGNLNAASTSQSKG